MEPLDLDHWEAAGDTALILGGGFSIADYFIWNEIPTVLGNLVGGLLFTGLTLYSTHARMAPSRKRERRSAAPLAASVDTAQSA